MLKKIAVSAVLAALCGCASMDKPDQDVREGMAAFKDAFNRRDAAALAMVYTEDAKLMPFNVPMMTGQAQTWRESKSPDCKPAWNKP